MSIILFIISFLASAVGSVSGVGGGIIIKPILDSIGMIDVSVINFLSACTVLAMATVSLIRARGRKYDGDKKNTSILAVSGAAGGIVGKYLFETLIISFQNDNLVGLIQAIMILIVLIGILFYVSNRQKLPYFNVTNGIACFVIGLLLGTLSSFLGIGGGPINIAVLYIFFSMKARSAAANSLYLIFMSQAASVIVTIVTKTVPNFPFIYLVIMISGGVLGGFVGSHFSPMLRSKQIEKIFKAVLIFITFVVIRNIASYVIMFNQ